MINSYLDNSMDLDIWKEEISGQRNNYTQRLSEKAGVSLGNIY